MIGLRMDSGGALVLLGEEIPTFSANELTSMCDVGFLALLKRSKSNAACGLKRTLRRRK